MILFLRRLGRRLGDDENVLEADVGVIGGGVMGGSSRRRGDGEAPLGPDGGSFVWLAVERGEIGRGLSAFREMRPTSFPNGVVEPDPAVVFASVPGVSRILFVLVFGLVVLCSD
jgi:hypothetical protein